MVRNLVTHHIPLLSFCFGVCSQRLGSFSKQRRRRQQEGHQTKGLMSETMAIRARFESWYISYPSLKNNVKQPSYTYFGEPETQRLIFRIFFWN